MPASIIVIGSSNTDLVIHTPKIPVAGQTVMGSQFSIHQGGKGANQAVAAARLGGKVTFVAKLGNESFGQNALQAFKAEGIDTTFVTFAQNSASGAAVILVDGNGENCIVVAPGSNALLSVADIDAMKQLFVPGSIVLIQLETPLETIIHAAAEAHKVGAKVILNPAPAQILPLDLLKNLYLITPNQTEAELLTGVPASTISDAENASAVFHAYGIPNVIITLGEQGAWLSENGKGKFLSGYKVNPVDTVAAGDTFNGALAVQLAEGASLEEAVIFANKAAAISVTRHGAQPSIPTRMEVEEWNF